jgi:cytoskeletal protein CcmA (bactofilin family)
MVFKRQYRPAPDQIDVVLGRRATFRGELRCDASIRLDGTVEGGLVETPGNVLITEGARVMADIKAKTVSLAGAYKGVITADRVELLQGGRLWGTIHVRSFLLDEGAHFQGELVMVGETAEEPFLLPRPESGDRIPVEEAPRETPTGADQGTEKAP